MDLDQEKSPQILFPADDSRLIAWLSMSACLSAAGRFLEALSSVPQTGPAQDQDKALVQEQSGGQEQGGDSCLLSCSDLPSLGPCCVLVETNQINATSPISQTMELQFREVK